MTFLQALKYYGTKTAIAKMLGVRKQNLTRWELEGIPMHHQEAIEQDTGGKLKANPVHKEDRRYHGNHPPAIKKLSTK